MASANPSQISGQKPGIGKRPNPHADTRQSASPQSAPGQSAPQQSAARQSAPGAQPNPSPIITDYASL